MVLSWHFQPVSMTINKKEKEKKEKLLQTYFSFLETADSAGD